MNALRNLPYACCYILYAVIIGPGMIFVVVASVCRFEHPAMVLPCLLALPLVYLTGTVFHELGHAVAACAGRMKLCTIAMGPLVLDRKAGRMCFRMQTLGSWWWGGYVTAVPRHLENLWRWQLWEISAGPLVTLALAVLCATTAMMLNRLTPWKHPYFLETDWPSGRYWMPATPLAALCTAGALLQLGGFLLCVVPGQVWGGIPNDAAQFLDWLLHPLQSERKTILGALAYEMVQGLRPRDWPLDFVQRLLNPGDGEPQDVHIFLFGYYHAMDCGQTERAGELLDTALAEMQKHPEPWPASVPLEGAFFEGFIRRDAAWACHWWNVADPSSAEQHTQLRARAAVLFAQGALTGARQAVDNALQAVGQSKDLGGSQAERDWLEKMRSAIGVRVLPSPSA